MAKETVEPAVVKRGVAVVEPTVTAITTWVPVESSASTWETPVAIPVILSVVPFTLVVATPVLLGLEM